MPLDSDIKLEIESVIKDCIRKKFKNYSPETKVMPFHFRLLGEDRMALFSFIHSLNTSFGISIFEPIAEKLAKTNFSYVEKQYDLGNQISKQAQDIIQGIMNEISTTTGTKKSNKPKETEMIRKVCKSGEMNSLKLVKVDLCVVDSNNTTHLFDLKTAKPNRNDFIGYKRRLLEWAAIALAKDPEISVNTCIAIPYNPYEPNPYNRWTGEGILDIEYELMVSDEFWNFLGNGDVYDDLLGCFERAGLELRPEIDEYFNKFNTDL